MSPSHNRLLTRRQVPAGIDPGSLTPDKDFCRAARAGVAFAFRVFQFIQVGGVDDSCVAIDLHLGLWKLEPDKFIAALRTLFGRFQDVGFLHKGLFERAFQHDGVCRNQLIQLRLVIGEISTPDGFARSQYLLADLRYNS